MKTTTSKISRLIVTVLVSVGVAAAFKDAGLAVSGAASVGAFCALRYLSGLFDTAARESAYAGIEYLSGPCADAVVHGEYRMYRCRTALLRDFAGSR